MECKVQSDSMYSLPSHSFLLFICWICEVHLLQLMSQYLYIIINWSPWFLLGFTLDYAFHGFGQMYNDIYPPLNSFIALKTPCASLIHLSHPSNPWYFYYLHCSEFSRMSLIVKGRIPCHPEIGLQEYRIGHPQICVFGACMILCWRCWKNSECGKAFLWAPLSEESQILSTVTHALPRSGASREDWFITGKGTGSLHHTQRNSLLS